MLVQDGREGVRIVGRDDGAHPMAGLQHESGGLARATGVEARPVARVGGAPDTKATIERAQADASRFVDRLVADSLGAPGQVVAAEDHLGG